MSFADYYESKQQLLEKAEETPRVYSFYEMNSYKRVPVKESYDDEDEKIYVNLKPKDKIKILWEYENIYYPTARNLVIINEEGTQDYYFPCWGNKKLLHWVLSNTREIDA